MDNDGRALQWLVRALGRHEEGRADITELYDERAPVAPDGLPSLVRRAAALGLVAYRGPDDAGHISIWLTVQGEQALGSLQALDDV